MRVTICQAFSQVADLYRCRWQIEVFFKQIKQTLQLADFLGHNANAVRWQVWMALLVYVLLRCLSYVSKWAHSFTRLFLPRPFVVMLAGGVDNDKVGQQTLQVEPHMRFGGRLAPPVLGPVHANEPERKK